MQETMPRMFADTDAPKDASLAVENFVSLISEDPHAALAAFRENSMLLTTNQLIAVGERARPVTEESDAEAKKAALEAAHQALPYVTRVAIAVGDLLGDRHDIWAEYDPLTTREITDAANSVRTDYARAVRLGTFVRLLANATPVSSPVAEEPAAETIVPRQLAA